MDLLRSIPANSLDAVVTDPPYAIDRRGDTDELQDRGMRGMQSANWQEKSTHSRGYADNDPRLFQSWCAEWMSELFRVLKPGAHVVAFGGTRTWHRLMTAAEDTGFEVRDTIAWSHGAGRPKTSDHALAAVKKAPEAVESVRGKSTTLTPAFEPAILVRKPFVGTALANVLQFGTGALEIDGTRSPDGTGLGRRPSNGVVDESMLRALALGHARSLYPALRVSKPNQAERVRVDGVTHPTMKPLDLIRFLVRLVTPLGGVVLDPFAGSGTTAEAALLESRSGVSIERESSYLPLIRARLDRRDAAAAKSADTGEQLRLTY